MNASGPSDKIVNVAFAKAADSSDLDGGIFHPLRQWASQPIALRLCKRGG
jgi:hypothetical protein